MSPLEVYREFEAARVRQQDERDRDVTLAWHCVAIYARTMNDRRLPRLDTLLTRREPKRVPDKVRRDRLRAQRDAMLAFARRHNAEQRRKRARTKSKETHGR